MSWHVIQGMYYFSYGNAQPHTLYGTPGTNHAVIVFKITQGLIGTDRTCDGGDASGTNPEIHIDVKGINVVFAGRWGTGVEDRFFSKGGQARLYFDKGTRVDPITPEQIVELDKIFKGKTENPAFDEFESIPNTSWLPNANLTQTTTINDNATAGSGTPGTFRLINLPAQNIATLKSDGTPTGNTKPLNPAQMQLNPLERDSAKADTDFQRLVNAAPKFRLGGQFLRDPITHVERDIDVEGTTLASSANSFFVDPDMGLLNISGNGEYRSFLYAGADEEALHLGIMQLLYSTSALIEFMPVFPQPGKGGFIKVDSTMDPIGKTLIRGTTKTVRRQDQK
jgi:hypothetical protein